MGLLQNNHTINGFNDVTDYTGRGGRNGKAQASHAEDQELDYRSSETDVL